MNNIFDFKNHFTKYYDVKSHLLYGDLESVPEPSVSIMMPVFNHPRFFKKALESALYQDYSQSYEIIVVDNNPMSHEETEYYKIIQSTCSDKVFYYRNDKNIGMLGNWNRCIEMARAPYVTFLHDDDMFMPSTLTLLMKLHEKYPDNAIFVAHNDIDEYDKIIGKGSMLKEGTIVSKNNICKYTLFDQFMNTVGFGVGFLFHRLHLLEMGGYDEACYPSADYALQMVYSWKYGAIYCDIPTFNYRVLENESTYTYKLFADTDKQFRKFCTKYLCLPNFLLNRIIQANYNVSKWEIEQYWGDKQSVNVSKPSRKDLKIVYLVNRFRKHKHRLIKV